ncbi:MAG: hypothetical protein ACXVPY_04550 [Bacteroidia bacterium]
MRKLFLHITFLLPLLVLGVAGFSQDSTMLRRHPPKKSILDKFYIGGNLGFQFGAQTVADVSPLIGYKITDKISAGVGATYQYYHLQNRYYNFETNVYGGRVFGRYHFTDYLFAHVEYEYLNLEAFDFNQRRVDVESLLAGGGYIQRFGRNSGVVAMILYNFTETAYTPYTNPIIRIGVIVGL